MLVADGEEKLKLAADRPRLGPTRMENLANFPCYSLAREIGLRSHELVIMKEEIRCIATATLRRVAMA